MSQKPYRVKSIGWGEVDDSDAHEFMSFDADDAVVDWCKFGDSNSWFVDGYPDNHEVEVIHPDGRRTRHLVSTDWSPDFYVSDKASA